MTTNPVRRSRPAYYNEFDPAAARWLRELMHEGLIAQGDVDERSIRDVRGDDLRGYAQCHFFAGIGVWSHALRRAGWPDDRQVWTGSCPCQPFSAAGKGLGFADDRHLWPEFLRLIAERRPHVVFGEQVASADAWIDLVSVDLEAVGYAFGAPDLPSAGFGGAHIRQRRYWVADADNTEWWSERAPRNDGDWPATGRVEGDGHTGGGVFAGWLADAVRGGAGHGPGSRLGSQAAFDRGDGHLSRERLRSGFESAAGGMEYPSGVGRVEWGAGADGRGAAGGCGDGGLGNASLSGSQERILQSECGDQRSAGPAGLAGGRSGSVGALRSATDWLLCRDGRWRPVEAGTFPLAPASPGRVGLLRGYGNALDAEPATQFIGAYLDCAPAERVAA